MGRFVETTAVMWPRVRKREAGEGVGGRKPKTEPRWLCFGSTVRNGGGGRWREVVWWLVGDDSGRGAAHSQAQGGGRGWGAENPKPSTTARFWAASGRWDV